MIRLTTHSTLKAIFHKAIFTVLISTSVITMQAQSSDDAVSKPANSIVKYLGTEEDMYVFAVKYFNMNGNKFVLQIKDNTGDLLFKEIYSSKVFSKKFKIPRELEGKLSFVIKDMKDNVSQTYLVNTNTVVSEDVVVTKIN